MKIEIRADGAHISGYVNATEKKSRPVITPYGRVLEEIEPGAFEGALSRAENIRMTKDHENITLAETRAGSLELFEDHIGLYAEALVTDEETIEEARAGKIKGWSFGMYNVSDELEQRGEGYLPIRKIKSLDLDHITLVIKKVPCYSATSVEVRAEGEERTFETRSTEEKLQITEERAKSSPPFFDNSAYRARVEAIKQKNSRKREENK